MRDLIAAESSKNETVDALFELNIFWQFSQPPEHV